MTDTAERGEGPDTGNVEAPRTEIYQTNGGDESAALSSHPSRPEPTDEGAAALEVERYLETTGYEPEDQVSVNYKDAAGDFRSEVTPVAKAPTVAAQHSDGDVWIGKCTLTEGVAPGRRGTAADVNGIRNMWADLDVKPGGLPSMAEAQLVIRDVSQMLGTEPAAIVMSGHGLQPSWLIDREDETRNFEPGSRQAREWAARLRRFDRLVRMVAAGHGGGVDNVSDLPRVMRSPGSVNRKVAGKPESVTVEYPSGGALTATQIDDVLDAYSIAEYPEDEELFDAEVSSPDGWEFGPRTCTYVATMVTGWSKDKPQNRHPWLVGQATRLECAHRLGCITAADFEQAREKLAERFRTRLNVGAKRKETPGEIASAFAWARAKVSTFTEARAAEELGDHEHPEAPAPRVPAAPVALEELEATVRTWLGEDYERVAMHAVMAVTAASRYLCEMKTPAWLLILGGSGLTKTQTLAPLADSPGAVMVSSISSEAALLSGSPDRERAADASGGLFREVTDEGVLIIKDFTSILSLPHESKKQILGAFREAHDGEWTRHMGVDGGRTLQWKGRLTVVGAVTSAWDNHYSDVAQMGDRFLVIRPRSANARAAGLSAARAFGREDEMNADLIRVVSGVLDNIDPEHLEPMSEATLAELFELADLVTWARTAVLTDYRGEVISADEREAPTRFLKQLQFLYAGARLIGLEEADAVQMCRRIAADTLPPRRREVLVSMLGTPGPQTAYACARDLGQPETTVRRTIDQLWLLGLLGSTGESGLRGNGWELAAGLEDHTVAALRAIAEVSTR